MIFLSLSFSGRLTLFKSVHRALYRLPSFLSFSYLHDYSHFYFTNFALFSPLPLVIHYAAVEKQTIPYKAFFTSDNQLSEETKIMPLKDLFS